MVGSQIVGLIPLKALLDSADFYISRDRLFIIEEEHKVRLVRKHFSVFASLSSQDVNLFFSFVSSGDQ